MTTTTAGPAEGNVGRDLAYGNAMRVIASVAVIAIHAQQLFHGPQKSAVAIAVAAFLDAGMRWSVPLFFMLSGALLLAPSKREPPLTFYAKRMRRFGVPVLAWSLLYAALPQADPTTRVATPEWTHRVAVSFARGAPKYHLWFAYSLLGLYAITPALRVGTRALTVAEQRTFAAIALGLAICAATTWTVLGVSNFPLPPESNVFVGWLPFLGFFTLGGVLRDWRPGRPAVRLATLAFVTLVGANSAGLHSAVAAGGSPNDQPLFQDYLSPVVVAISLSAWTLGVATLGSLPRGLRWIGSARLGDATLAVYLSHVLLLDAAFLAATRLGLGGLPTPLLDPIVVAMTTVGSFGLAIALRAVPGVWRIVG